MAINHQHHGRTNLAKRYKPMAEINVTPFVDVMLVLLVIFMVTAPLMSVGVPVDLPETRASQINDSDEPLVITMNEEGQIFLQETVIEADRLIANLQAMSLNNPDIRIFIRGDQNLAYGEVMRLMGAINQAGFKRVALLSKRPE